MRESIADPLESRTVVEQVSVPGGGAQGSDDKFELDRIKSQKQFTKAILFRGPVFEPHPMKLQYSTEPMVGSDWLAARRPGVPVAGLRRPGSCLRTRQRCRRLRTPECASHSGQGTSDRG